MENFDRKKKEGENKGKKYEQIYKSGVSQG